MLDAGLGCPNRDGTLSSDGCIFCNPRGSGTGAHSQGASIGEQLDRGISALSRRYRCRKFIAYFQSFTNTYAPVDRLAALYGQALARPEVVGLAIGTRPDCVPPAVLELIAELAADRLVWLELGLQSVHPRTLELVNRGHSPEAFFNATAMCRDRTIPVVAHLILGLPGESVADMVETAGAVSDAGVWGVKLHPLYVVRCTGLERVYDAGGYRPMTENEAIDATLAVLETLRADMVVHRMTSDPHPRELVAPGWMLDRRRVRERLEKAMLERNSRQGSRYMGLREPEPRMGAVDAKGRDAKK